MITNTVIKMGSDELISYIEDNYEDLEEKFIEYYQELFDIFCMEQMDD